MLVNVYIVYRVIYKQYEDYLIPLPPTKTVACVLNPNWWSPAADRTGESEGACNMLIYVHLNLRSLISHRYILNVKMWIINVLLHK
ncbi:hypothetical protein Lalb_Chr19g0137301 [Lupinus albus]|uniref:Uncharacterized protein n=1 Tax=Lupinus albus TaxID=3870 RepID=A0A6A4NV70_LUPAL|nr:hypothetical protein Lalb_Chr19g0137301 [Lupinus albus]